jgi:hypothetical protein
MKELIYVIPQRRLWDLIKNVKHYRIVQISNSGEFYLLGLADQCPEENSKIVYGMLKFLKDYLAGDGYYVFHYRMEEFKYLGQSIESIIINIVSGEIDTSYINTFEE